MKPKPKPYGPPPPEKICHHVDETICETREEEQCVEYEEQTCYEEEEENCTDVNQFVEIVEVRELARQRFAPFEENENYKSKTNQTEFTLCEDRDGKYGAHRVVGDPKCVEKVVDDQDNVGITVQTAEPCYEVECTFETGTAATAASPVPKFGTAAPPVTQLSCMKHVVSVCMGPRGV